MKKNIILCLASGVFGALISASIVKADPQQFLEIRDAVHMQVAILGKDPSTLPVPKIPKGWHLKQVISEDASTYHYALWFQDDAGNVFRMDSRLRDDGNNTENMGISPKVLKIPAE